MDIKSVGNRNSPPAVLRRESYRWDGNVRKRTAANLSCFALRVIEGLKVLLRDGVAVASAEEVLSIERSFAVPRFCCDSGMRASEIESHMAIKGKPVKLIGCRRASLFEPPELILLDHVHGFDAGDQSA